LSRLASFVRANWPALLIALAGAAVMLAFAGQYGMHRDEMYFVIAGRHPDFGYVDQPPLTPLLSALEVQLFGASAFALRIAPTIAYVLVVVLAAFIAREFGGGRPAQTIAALTVAVSGWVAAAHLDSTETYDILGWTLLLAFLIPALKGGNPRLWLLIGVVAGVTLENKDLLVLLGIGLAAGVLISRRWDLLRSPWVWAGLAVAFAIWLPNLIWQAANGWPQLEMSRVIAARDGDGNRGSLLLIQILFAGPLLFPIFVAGLWRLLRSADAKPWRAIGWAYLVVLVVLFVTKGKGYYSAGLIPAITAAGAVPAARWLTAGRRAWMLWGKRATYAVATVLSAVVIVSIALPIVPAADFPNSEVARANSDAVSTYGWPSFVTQVEAVTNGLGSADRQRAFILTGNYGEAGALELLGSPDLPPVYSGHNSYWSWGPPDDGRTIGVVVMGWQGAGDYFSAFFGPCSLAARIDLGFPPGVSEEQGAGIWVCRERTLPWSEIWADFRHFS
jgi:4-amino-4-deoxy-L-arabinose transferase-like glycosyltransferase